jgi:hypothetical protein
MYQVTLIQHDGNSQSLGFLKEFHPDDLGDFQKLHRLYGEHSCEIRVEEISIFSSYHDIIGELLNKKRAEVIRNSGRKTKNNKE